MSIDPNTALEFSAALVTATGGIYGVLHHFSQRAKRKKIAYRQEILDQAQLEMSRIESSLELKIRNLEVVFEAQKLSVSKDFSHFKETYHAEVKSLGEKIEALREDLSQQHQALVGLLTKLVDTK